MRITDRIAETLSDIAVDRYVTDVRIGVKYVGVQLDDSSIGAAYLFPESIRCDNVSFPGDNPLTGRNATELLTWLNSDNLLYKSIGLATANALTESLNKEIVPGDIRSVIEFRTGEQVVMVGYFEPLVQGIRNQCRLNIYELDTSISDGLMESSDATKGLKSCDVALITSTSIINGTIDSLLEAATECREVVILGPSTPLVSEAFNGTPVTLLSGVVVIDDQILRVVSEGGGMKHFKPYVHKLNLRVN